MSHLLSWVVFWPLGAAALLALIPKRMTLAVRLWANAAALIGLLLAAPLWTGLERGDGGFQFVERAPWIPSIGASYAIGIDGISLLLVLLTALIGFLAVLCSWNAVREREKEFYGLLLVLQTGMLGVFVALDFFLFYVFWEVVLVPMYFLIGMFGGERRQYAAIKFFLYTLAGSVLMLLGLLTLYFQHFRTAGFYTFDIEKLMAAPLAPGVETWVFWALFVGFAIKVPMVPFHTWLPDAHVEAPTAGSVILAGVMLKMGAYGFLRFSLPMLPRASSDPFTVNLLVALSLIAILYGALVCLMQQDWKKLVAYSSVSHLGFATLGIFTFTPNGIAGSVVQQVNHGLATGLLFLLVGMLYERRHTRLISDYGGVATVMPHFAVAFALAMLSSAGLPLLGGFIGEFTVIAGAFERSRLWAALAAIGIVLGAAYLLWLYQRTMFGPLTRDENRGLRDLSLREIVVLAPLLALTVWIGVYPKPFFEILEKPVQKIVERVQPDYYRAESRP